MPDLCQFRLSTHDTLYTVSYMQLNPTSCGYRHNASCNCNLLCPPTPRCSQYQAFIVFCTMVWVTRIQSSSLLPPLVPNVDVDDPGGKFEPFSISNNSSS